MIFKNRTDAGKQLAQKIKDQKISPDIVIGLPRGGVPVAAIVAKALKLPLSVVVARKLSHPMQPELGVGAIAEHDVLVLNSQLVRQMNLDQAELQPIIKNEKEELERRVDNYRQGKHPDLKEQHVLVIDDGLATGITALASIKAIKHHNPQSISFAVPVAPPESIGDVKDQVDHFICLQTPRHFRAVGQFYQYFDQTSDQEVVKLLKNSSP